MHGGDRGGVHGLDGGLHGLRVRGHEGLPRVGVLAVVPVLDAPHVLVQQDVGVPRGDVVAVVAPDQVRVRGHLQVAVQVPVDVVGVGAAQRVCHDKASALGCGFVVSDADHVDGAPGDAAGGPAWRAPCDALKEGEGHERAGGAWEGEVLGDAELQARRDPHPAGKQGRREGGHRESVVHGFCQWTCVKRAWHGWREGAGHERRTPSSTT